MTAEHQPTPAQEAMAHGIRWEDPPPRRARSTALPWSQWARLLRRHPGRWARLHDFDKPTAAGRAIVNTSSARRYLPRPDYELRSSRNGDQSTVYARYVPDDER